MSVGFQREDQRMLDPQARLIPEYLWRRYWLEPVISETELGLMQGEPDLGTLFTEDYFSENAVSDILYARHRAEKRRRALLCFVLAHPDAPLEAITSLCSKLYPCYSPEYSYAQYFDVAAESGRLDVVNRLIKLADEADAKRVGWLRTMFYRLFGVKRNSNSALEKLTRGCNNAFRLAASGGHMGVLNRLVALADEADAKRVGWLRIMFYRLFGIKQASETVSKMLACDQYEAFMSAATNGHLDVLNRLIELASPATVSHMLSSIDCGAFRFVAANGHLAVLNRLIELASPATVSRMLSSIDYGAFRFAAANGHLAVLNRLIELANRETPSVILSTRWYSAFESAAANGHLAVLNRLIELENPETVSILLSSNDYEAFRSAAANSHLAVINRLLSFNNCFSWAELHHEIYDRFVPPFIEEKLLELQRHKQAAEGGEPPVVFDVDAETARLCFYMIRNLIRRNSADLTPKIEFLLNIPAVRALAATAVDGQNNQLIRLAVTVGNQAACERLLEIPAVRELAAQNNFYRVTPARAGAAGPEIDLRTLAANRESSMRTLSVQEVEMLRAARERYAPSMAELGGEQDILAALIKKLQSVYESSPATIVTPSRAAPVQLPFDWASFQALRRSLPLPQEEYREALQAYHGHQTHTALRFLSIPNFWMHEQAAFVEVDPRDIRRKWAAFESHKPLIAMLWLASRDVTIPDSDGCTAERREQCFFAALAEINRAHNWDDRTSDDTTQGDRPSCSPGMKARLFQSVPAHPLLCFLTKEIAEQALIGFIRQHFVSKIKDKDERQKVEFLAALEVSLGVAHEEPNPGSLALLKTLDVDEAAKQDFFKAFTKLHGPQAENFREYLKGKLLIGPQETHATKFCLQTEIMGLLQPETQKTEERNRPVAP